MGSLWAPRVTSQVRLWWHKGSADTQPYQTVVNTRLITHHTGPPQHYTLYWKITSNWPFSTSSTGHSSQVLQDEEGPAGDLTRGQLDWSSSWYLVVALSISVKTLDRFLISCFTELAINTKSVETNIQKKFDL